MFYSQINRPKTRPNKVGSHYIPEYQERINEETGEYEVVEIGKINIYAQIQIGAEETKIQNILKQVAMGDYSVLQQREATYIDATTMPKTLMEAQNLIIKAKAEFEKFPMEVKNLFDNNCDKYIAEMGTKEFFEKMTPYNEKMRKIEEAGSAAAYNKKVAEAAKFNNDVKAAEGGNE